ncbi:MAG TPA: hypothetical protein VMV69_19205 [Pirellulales bacterium]|nr:hypothetical protein [Pirellulales bacterium]
MNALGISLLWMALQVTVFCLAGAGAYLVARRHGPAWGAVVLCGALVITVGIAALSFSPWPRWWTLGDARAAARPFETTTDAEIDSPGRPTIPATISTTAATAEAGGDFETSAGFLTRVFGRFKAELVDEPRARLNVDPIIHRQRAAELSWLTNLVPASTAGNGAGRPGWPPASSPAP